MSDLLDPLRKDLHRLGGTTIEIRAVGRYPTKQRTPVQHVAHYQNDGTEKIKPAQFVQKTARRKRYWQRPLYSSVGKFIFKKRGGMDLNNLLAIVGRQIADDINFSVNRIKTGRLRTSMRAVVIEGGDGGRGRYYAK